MCTSVDSNRNLWATLTTMSGIIKNTVFSLWSVCHTLKIRAFLRDKFVIPLETVFEAWVAPWYLPQCRPVLAPKECENRPNRDSATCYSGRCLKV